MDSSEKTALFLSGVALTVFFLAVLFAAKALNAEVPECLPATDIYTQGGVEDMGDNTYQVKYVAKMWGFDPATVELPVGSTVDLYLTSQDVVHGLNIYRKNVNMMAVPGALNKTTVKFNEPGRYRVICHEYCGTGHHFMQGEIIIK